MKNLPFYLRNAGQRTVRVVLLWGDQFVSVFLTFLWLYRFTSRWDPASYLIVLKIHFYECRFRRSLNKVCSCLQVREVLMDVVREAQKVAKLKSDLTSQGLETRRLAPLPQKEEEGKRRRRPPLPSTTTRQTTTSPFSTGSTAVVGEGLLI